MELPKIGLSEGGVLGGLKSKFLGKYNDAEYDEYDGYDGYDGYDDYSDYSDEYGSYDDYENRGGRGSDLSQAATSTRAGVTRPRLVSLEDVKANTQLEIGSAASRESDSRLGSESVLENVPDWRPRSEGLDSLFRPTSGMQEQPAAEPAPAVSAQRHAVSPYSEQPTLRRAFGQYGSSEASQPSLYRSVRSLVVIKPVSYADVERVAKRVAAGDVVVLSMRNTQEALSKRILDFSFGVASALDAHVDCLADKVFAISIGEAPTQSELQSLKSQGVL